MEHEVLIKLISAGLFADLAIISSKILIYQWCSLLPNYDDYFKLLYLQSNRFFLSTILIAWKFLH